MSKNTSDLISDLDASDPTKRAAAAERLSRLGLDARQAAVPLVRACADQAEEVREWAVAALEELGPPLPADVDELASLLGEDSADVGYWAATLLGRLEAEAAPAVAALAAVVSGPLEMPVRQRAAWALERIGPPAGEALDVLRQAAAGDDPRLARLAQRAVAQIGG